jgi:hypothetical protein
MNPRLSCLGQLNIGLVCLQQTAHIGLVLDASQYTLELVACSLQPPLLQGVGGGCRLLASTQ